MYPQSQVWIIFGRRKQVGNYVLLRVCTGKPRADQDIEELKKLSQFDGWEFYTDTYPVWG